MDSGTRARPLAPFRSFWRLLSVLLTNAAAFRTFKCCIIYRKKPGPLLHGGALSKSANLHTNDVTFWKSTASRKSMYCTLLLVLKRADAWNWDVFPSNVDGIIVLFFVHAAPFGKLMIRITAAKGSFLYKLLYFFHIYVYIYLLFYSEKRMKTLKPYGKGKRTREQHGLKKWERIVDHWNFLYVLHAKPKLVFLEKNFSKKIFFLYKWVHDTAATRSLPKRRVTFSSMRIVIVHIFG